MLRSLRFSGLALAGIFITGCYSGLDIDEMWPTLSPSGSTQPGDLSEGVSEGPDSPTSSTTGEPDETTSEATTSPVVTTGGEPATTTETSATTGPDLTTGEPDPTNGTTTTGDPETTTNDPSTTSTTGNSNPDVPDGVPYCEPAETWDPAWKQLEEDILALVNEVRAQGANCGSKGNFGPAGPLTMNPALRCAARMHSKDMSDRNFFDHTNPDGESPWVRMGKAGYGGYSNAGENIAAGSANAAGTMNQWMNSDGHCANIMNPAFQHIGVGYHPGGQWGHLWTQVFGAK